MFTINICDKCPSSIPCWDLNPRPSVHASTPSAQPLTASFYGEGFRSSPLRESFRVSQKYFKSSSIRSITIQSTIKRTKGAKGKRERRDEQCDQIWRNFATLAKVYKSLAIFLTVYFLFGKILSLLWQNCDIIGLFFIVADGQILKNNPTIWSGHTGRRNRKKTNVQCVCCCCWFN